LKEKGGKEKDLPVRHKLEELLDQYLKATGLGTEPGSPLFPAALGKTGKLSRRSLVRTDAADMLKRRLKQAGLLAHYSPHSFRATGITNFLENDGTLEAAQRIAGHADSRTTKLYDRRGQKICWRIWRGFVTNNWTQTESKTKCRKTGFSSVIVAETKNGASSSRRISNHISGPARLVVGQISRMNPVYNGSQKFNRP
jgi:hypothetical protein